MFINERKNEIVATKAEYAKAMKVGTPEFDELFRARQLYPTAKVVIKKSKNQDNYPKLTKPFMLGYVEFKDKEYYDEFNKLFDLIGKPNFEDDSGEPKTYSFFDVREVFINRFYEMGKYAYNEFSARFALTSELSASTLMHYQKIA